MDKKLIAYLAGAMDSDGHFSIRKSTYHIRVRHDSVNPSYSEHIGLKQVTPHIPILLKKCFGGNLHLYDVKIPNRRPLYQWSANNRQAYNACVIMKPYIRVKKMQLKKILELRESKNKIYLRYVYWFIKKHPNWKSMELITCKQATKILGYKNSLSIHQAIRNGVLLALPGIRGRDSRRIPKALIEKIKYESSGTTHYSQPRELIFWKEKICNDVRELNKLGVYGTPTYHKTGCYKPKYERRF